jgi:hypothetical protein
MTSSERSFTQAPPPAIVILEDEDPLPRAADGSAPIAFDPALVVLTCANCGAAMDERKCKLICRCGYFLSCSDYY